MKQNISKGELRDIALLSCAVGIIKSEDCIKVTGEDKETLDKFLSSFNTLMKEYTEYKEDIKKNVDKFFSILHKANKNPKVINLTYLGISFIYFTLQWNERGVKKPISPRLKAFWTVWKNPLDNLWKNVYEVIGEDIAYNCEQMFYTIKREYNAR